MARIGDAADDIHLRRNAYLRYVQLFQRLFILPMRKYNAASCPRMERASWLSLRAANMRSRESSSPAASSKFPRQEAAKLQCLT